MLELRNADAVCAGRPALQGVSLSLHAGEHVLVLGRSGSGKSTLLGLLYARLAQQAALVPQAASLVQTLSVFHNVYMGRLDRHSTLRNLRMLAWPVRAEVAAVLATLASVGLEDKLFARAGTLSGGQQQRASMTAIQPGLWCQRLRRATSTRWCRRMRCTVPGRTSSVRQGERWPSAVSTRTISSSCRPSRASSSTRLHLGRARQGGKRVHRQRHRELADLAPAPDDAHAGRIAGRAAQGHLVDQAAQQRLAVLAADARVGTKRGQPFAKRQGLGAQHGIEHGRAGLDGFVLSPCQGGLGMAQLGQDRLPSPFQLGCDQPVAGAHAVELPLRKRRLVAQPLDLLRFGTPQRRPGLALGGARLGPGVHFRRRHRFQERRGHVGVDAGRLQLLAQRRALLLLQVGANVLAAAYGRAVERVVVAFEAGRDGFWLARWLRAYDVEAHVIHPTSIAVSREHRRAKTDLLDTGLLKRTVLGWLRGERGHCSMAAVPTLEEEDAKRPTREHESLVGERTRVVNRIKASLARLGVRSFKPMLRHAAERLGALRTPEGAPLPPNTLAKLRRDVARLGFVREQIKQIEDARVERLQRAPGKGLHAMVHLLARAVSVSMGTADMQVHEVLSRPMRDRKAVARYAGLTGAPDESGAKRREQGLAKAGNARVRRGMIQLAWRFLLHQKGSALAQWYRARTADARPGTRKTLIVALGRKLLVGLWRLATTGEAPDGIVLRPAA